MFNCFSTRHHSFGTHISFPLIGVIPTRLASGTPRGKLRVSPPQERKRDEVHVTFADSAA